MDVSRELFRGASSYPGHNDDPHLKAITVFAQVTFEALGVRECRCRGPNRDACRCPSLNRSRAARSGARAEQPALGKRGDVLIAAQRSEGGSNACFVGAMKGSLGRPTGHTPELVMP